MAGIPQCRGWYHGAVQGTLLSLFSFFFHWISGVFPYRLARMIYGCRSPSSDVENPGNNLYVTGLSHRITKKDIERHFSIEGNVCLQKIFCM